MGKFSMTFHQFSPLAEKFIIIQLPIQLVKQQRHLTLAVLLMQVQKLILFFL